MCSHAAISLCPSNLDSARSSLEKLSFAHCSKNLLVFLKLFRRQNSCKKTFKGLSDFTRVSHREGWPGWAPHRKMISHQPAHKRNFLHLCHGSGNRSRVFEHTKARASGETCEVDLQFQWIPKTFPFSGYLPSTQVKKIYLQFLHLEATPSKAFLPELTACLWLWLLFLLSWCLVVVIASNVVACMFLLIWFSYCSLLLKFWLSYCYGIVFYPCSICHQYYTGRAYSKQY